MATFTGFTTAQQGVLQQDITLGRQLCMRAVNSMLLTLSGRPSDRTAQLLWWVFSVPSDADVWDRCDPIKNVYLGFASRMSTPLPVEFDRSAPTGNVLDFDAYVPAWQNKIVIRSAYFSKAPRDRALTLLHETVHLRFPENGGDGHPGGQFVLFQPGNIQITYENAIRNAYCYMYYADWISS